MCARQQFPWTKCPSFQMFEYQNANYEIEIVRQQKSISV
jgi:hypothetical protein